MNEFEQKIEFKKELINSESNPNDFTINLTSSNEVNEYKDRIVSLFNTFGAVIIHFEEAENADSQLLCLRNIFGSTMNHDRANENMIAEIAVSDKFQGYLGTSNLAHPFHTDGAYDLLPPKAIALRCEVASREGGASRLISTESIFRELQKHDNNIASALFKNDALEIKREGRKSSQSIFHDDNGIIYTRYRDDETSFFSKDKDVIDAIEIVREFIKNPNNYLEFNLAQGDVLVVDNTSILHGRTEFKKTEPRKLQRLFFDGLPENSDLKFGFEK